MEALTKTGAPTEEAVATKSMEDKTHSEATQVVEMTEATEVAEEAKEEEATTDRHQVVLKLGEATKVVRATGMMVDQTTEEAAQIGEEPTKVVMITTTNPNLEEVKVATTSMEDKTKAVNHLLHSAMHPLIPTLSNQLLMLIRVIPRQLLSMQLALSM